MYKNVVLPLVFHKVISGNFILHDTRQDVCPNFSTPNNKLK